MKKVIKTEIKEILSKNFKKIFLEEFKIRYGTIYKPKGVNYENKNRVCE
jgi:hypothetical protein